LANLKALGARPRNSLSPHFSLALQNRIGA
jgi:hypothetical protein